MNNIDISQRLEEIRETIRKAQSGSPLAAAAVTLVAVTKQQPLAAIETALALGLRDFGENRVQEAEEKWSDVRCQMSDLKLHLIGPLQTNKVKGALELFDVIHTLDREKLALAIRDAWHVAHGTDFFIQVNTGEEPQKAGIAPKEAGDFIEFCMKDLKLPVIGLMCIPPQEEPPAPHFALLHEMAKRHELKHLSMGMSADYETAVRYGATHVRIGSALLGERTKEAP